MVKHCFVDQNVFEELKKESSKAETLVNPEQPSPVSVLDAAFYREDPPSPVRKKSDISNNLGKQHRFSACLETLLY